MLVIGKPSVTVVSLAKIVAPNTKRKNKNKKMVVVHRPIILQAMHKMVWSLLKLGMKILMKSSQKHLVTWEEAMVFSELSHIY